MCRNIKMLHNFKPPATVDQVAQAARELLDSLVTTAPPRDREVEAARARARSAERFGSAAPAS
jgi:hypothetical protein